MNPVTCNRQALTRSSLSQMDVCAKFKEIPSRWHVRFSECDGQMDGQRGPSWNCKTRRTQEEMSLRGVVFLLTYCTLYMTSVFMAPKHAWCSYPSHTKSLDGLLKNECTTQKDICLFKAQFQLCAQNKLLSKKVACKHSCITNNRAYFSLPTPL